VSVWEERQKAQAGNVWNIPRPAGEGAPAPSSADRYFEEDYESEREKGPAFSERPPPPSHARLDRDRHERRERPRDRTDQTTSRRFMDTGQRKALEDASNCISNMSQVKPSEPKKQITIQQKPKLEILQKPVPSAAPKPAPVQSSGAPTSNYWQEKQAERDRLEAEEEKKRRELQKAEAQKARQQQYQDYRTPDQYDGSAFDEDERRQYDEEREAEREKRSIRRRGQDEFYDNDRSEKPARAERRQRRKREEVFKIEYREPREPRGSKESRNSREPRQAKESRERKRHDSHEQRHDSRDYREQEFYDSRDRRYDSRDRYDRDEKVVDSRRRYNRTYNYYDEPDRFYYERPEVRERPKRQERNKKVVQSEPKEESSPTTGYSEEGEFETVEDKVEELADDDEALAFEEEPVLEEEIEEKTDPEPKLPREKVSRERSSRDQDRMERYDRERRDPRERYDRERYERPDFTTYRREPRSSRGERSRDSRREEPRRERRTRPEREPKDPEGVPRSDEKKSVSKQRTRVDKSRTDQSNRRNKSERRARRPREGEEWVSSDEQRSKSSAPRAKPASDQHAEQSDENAEKQEKPERPPRRARKTPSLRYYSANPADRLKSSSSVPPKSSSSEDKSKDKVVRSKSDVRSRESKKDPKREPSKKESAEAKPNESSSKTKTKDPAAEAKKAKKIEKTKLEMDRLKKMTQSGMDLLTLGIYAVDGKELDDQEAADYSEGFVEVVRKKSKKEPEPEKKPAAKSKKSKKSGSKAKKTPISQEEAKQATVVETAASASTTSASPTGIEKPPSNPTSVKSWSSNTAVDLPLMSNIWSNPKKNAWDKPLTFSEKQTIDPREILAPISGESTSLFSSDADLAKKTKEKNWRGSEARPPRFAKSTEKAAVAASENRKIEKKQSKEELEEEEEEEKELQLPSSVLSGSTLDLNIPPVVEDLFGIRSDGEDEKTTLSSLVLDTKITAPVVAPPVVGLSQRDRVPTAPPPPEQHSSEELSDTPKDMETSPDLVSAETSTQTTPPAPRPLVEDPVQVPPLTVGDVSPPSRTPNLNTAVKQMITSTSGLSLTDQLREIGQAQLAQQQADRSQFFAMQGIQGSPLMQSLQNSPGLHPEPPIAAPQHPQQPLLGHFITPPTTEMSPHILPSPHQIGGNTTSLPLIGSHPISSPLSSLGNIVNRPNPVTTADLFKNYMSPMSPTNKIYPGSNQNFVNQNIHQFMSNQFLTNQSSGNYGSPSMSPIPSQMNPFAQFQQKSSSPKLQNLYNSPQGSFDGLDPTGMMSFGQQLQKPSSTPLTNQQLFYQRMMPGQEMYYKLKPTDNILLQSDMSKHVDAKPFNPGGNPGNMPPPRPGMFKPELLQHVMQPNGPSPVLPHLSYKPINQGFEKETIGARPTMVQRPITSDFSAINGLIQQNMPNQQNIQRMPHALFPQQSSRQDATAFIQQQAAAIAAAKTVNPMVRNMPRVKLARDGRLHRVPDMRNKFNSMIPHSVQQVMQQQSLASIQQYQAAIARGEDPAKETLPDNMKPAASSPIKPPPPEKLELSPSAPPETSPSPVKDQPQQPFPQSPVGIDKAPGSPVKTEAMPVEKIIVEEEPRKKVEETKSEEKEKKAEKRKHSETRNTYRRRNYGYPAPEYDYYDGYHEERYHDRYHDERYHDDRYYDDRRHDDRYREDRYHDDRHRYRGGGPRNGPFPPHPMYRGYPPPPPRDYRRGGPPPHRHRY